MLLPFLHFSEAETASTAEVPMVTARSRSPLTTDTPNPTTVIANIAVNADPKPQKTLYVADLCHLPHVPYGAVISGHIQYRNLVERPWVFIHVSFWILVLWGCRAWVY